VDPWEIALTALGAVGLFVLGSFSELLRSRLARKAADRDREARRKAEREDRRDAFELDTLIELQDAIQSRAQVTFKAYVTFEDEYRRHQTWGATNLEDEIGGSAALQIQSNLRRLRGRVLDQRLSDLLGEFDDACMAPMVLSVEPGTTATQRRTAVEIAVQKLMEVDRRLQARIRERFRELHHI
jgi:hypothetical protein